MDWEICVGSGVEVKCKVDSKIDFESGEGSVESGVVCGEFRVDCRVWIVEGPLKGFGEAFQICVCVLLGLPFPPPVVLLCLRLGSFRWPRLALGCESKISDLKRALVAIPQHGLAADLPGLRQSSITAST